MSIYINLKNPIIYLLLLVINGCSNSGFSNQNNSGCPEKPTATLEKKNVKEISLQEQKITVSGQVSVTKNIGYTFKAKQGQKLNYGTDDDICIWIFTPDNSIVTSTELPQTGTYIIQVAAPRGSKTFDLDFSFGSLKPPSPPSPPSVSSTPKIIISPKTSQLTQDRAVEIVNNWYKAKPKIFGKSFDKSLVEKYTIGKLYQDTLKIDGSMNWLRNNGCYYTYNISNIENIISFSNTGQRPTLTVKVYEELQLHGPRQAGCGNPLHSYTANVTYWFEKDNGEWKIYHYKVNK